MREIVGRLAMHAARTYIRHAPTPTGKARLFDRVSWRPHHGHGRTVDGVEMHLDTASTVDRHIWYFGLWEPAQTEWLRRSLGPGDGFVDVGAHSGYYSLLASRLVEGGGRVTAIEASPSICDLLRRNVEANEAANVRVLHMAAAREAGELAVYRHPDPGRSRTSARFGMAPEATVPARPLSDVLTRDEWRHVRLVKIDVEGAEPGVIAGMEPLLYEAREDLEVLLEFTPAICDLSGDSAGELLDIMERHGFHAYRLAQGIHTGDYLSAGECIAPRVRPDIGAKRQMDLVFSRRDARELRPVRSVGRGAWYAER